MAFGSDAVQLAASCKRMCMAAVATGVYYCFLCMLPAVLHQVSCRVTLRDLGWELDVVVLSDIS